MTPILPRLRLHRHQQFYCTAKVNVVLSMLNTHFLPYHRILNPSAAFAVMGITSSNGGRPNSAYSTKRLAVPDNAEVATVAAGCFWGVEHIYRKHFPVGENSDSGMYDVRVGYIGGNTKSPTYRAVCSKTTGHAEATRLYYNPSRITYRQLIEFFYRMHDPTQLDHQGPDHGPQYRSAIFAHTAVQEKIAREVTTTVEKQWKPLGKWEGRSVVTQVVRTDEDPVNPIEWWDAEDYHQRYLDINPDGYQCPSHFLRNFPPLKYPAEPSDGRARNNSSVKRRGEAGGNGETPNGKKDADSDVPGSMTQGVSDGPEKL